MPLKFGLALALVVGQMSAQAAGNGLVLPPEAANNEGTVIVTTDKVKAPKKQHQIKLGKVKPDEFPTKPQQAVKALR